MSDPRRPVRVIREYKIEYPDPIQVARGERVTVGREDEEFPGWRWCMAANGHEGWVPVELLSDTGTEALVLKEYSARELAVQAGEEVFIEEDRHGWLFIRNSRGECGWLPATHVAKLKGEASERCPHAFRGRTPLATQSITQSPAPINCQLTSFQMV
jgi:SH3-like domain-containing protein